MAGVSKWWPAGRMCHSQATPTPALQGEKTLRYVMIHHVTSVSYGFNPDPRTSAFSPSIFRNRGDIGSMFKNYIRKTSLFAILFCSILLLRQKYMNGVVEPTKNYFASELLVHYLIEKTSHPVLPPYFWTI